MAAVTYDVSATGNNGSGATTVVSATLTPNVYPCLLVAGVSANASVSSMSGGGLTWTQWDAISGTGIKAALWYALALSPFSDAVTANLASSVAASIIVSAYYNVRVADTTGTASIAANGVRTHGTSATSSPSVSDTASYSNCLGVGVCASDTVLSASAGSGMTLNAQDAAA